MEVFPCRLFWKEENPCGKYWYKLPFIDYNDGATQVTPPSADVALSTRFLKRGMRGGDVKAMQEFLLQLGYALPKYGADSDFGSETPKL